MGAPSLKGLINKEEACK